MNKPTKLTSDCTERTTRPRIESGTHPELLSERPWMFSRVVGGIDGSEPPATGPGWRGGGAFHENTGNKSTSDLTR